MRLRLYPGDAATGILLTAIAGACRHVWNHMLADQERRYHLWQAYQIGPKPVPTFFTLGRRFTQLRHDPDHAWLKDYPFACVRYSLKYLADAYQRYFKDPQTEGKPRFKARHCTRAGLHHSRGRQAGRGSPCMCPRSAGCGCRAAIRTRTANR